MTSDQTERVALAPCPFCGGPGSLRKQDGSRDWHVYFAVGCERCDFESIDDTEAKCVSFWNRRAPHAPDVRALVDAARQVCAYADMFGDRGDVIDERQRDMWICELRMKLMSFKDTP